MNTTSNISTNTCTQSTCSSTANLENTDDYYVQQFNTGCLSQFSYYIESDKEAAIIDPVRESDMYIDLLEKRGAKLKYVIETHFHADFVSGHVELANLTGAKIVFGPNAKPEYEALVCEEGEELNLGNIKLKIFHTPGHTMESTSYILIDPKDKPKAIFTGDFLFLGEVGRPDLAVGGSITEKDLASHLYESILKLKQTIPDDVIVFPGHGAGSACGKNISTGTKDTLGNQKKTNYALNDNLKKEEFIEIVTTNLPTPPQYFFFDVMMNKKGYEAMEKVLEKTKKEIKPEEFVKLVTENNDVVIIDSRDSNESIKGFFRGSYLISLKITYAIWSATLFSPEQKIILITDPGKERESIIRLARVGYENILGYVEGGYDNLQKYCSENGLSEYITSITTVDPSKYKELIEEIIDKDTIQLIDVREKSEWESTGIVPNSKLIPLGQLEKNIEEFIAIGKQKPLGVFCKAGGRASIAGSILKKYQIPKVYFFGGILNMIEKKISLKPFKF